MVMLGVVALVGVGVVAVTVVVAVTTVTVTVIVVVSGAVAAVPSQVTSSRP
jgi:hypothetical protein